MTARREDRGPMARASATKRRLRLASVSLGGGDDDPAATAASPAATTAAAADGPATGAAEEAQTPAEQRKRAKKHLVITHRLLPAGATDAVADYRIRPMQFKDCAPCFHLGEKVFTSQYPNLYRLWDEYEVVDAYSSDHNKCYVAVTPDDKLIGFIFGDEIRKRNSWRYGYVHWIAVDPLYRRRGIGTELYNQVAPLMQREDGVRMILCDTPADNYEARRFFEKLGFGDPISHVYMSRNLTQPLETASTHAPDGNISGSGPEASPLRRSGRHGRGAPASAASAAAAAAASDPAPKKHAPKRKVNVTVREMIIDDLYEVYELGEGVFGDRSWPNLFRFWEPSEVLDLFETDSEFCLVAEVDDTIVGFCLGTTISKKKSAWKYGYPIWLGVSPDHQGAGIGLALYQHFQERAVADGARMIFIDTQANSPAVHFWRRQGFGHAQAHVFMSKDVARVPPAAASEAAAAAASDRQHGDVLAPAGDSEEVAPASELDDASTSHSYSFHAPTLNTTGIVADAESRDALLPGGRHPDGARTLRRQRRPRGTAESTPASSASGSPTSLLATRAPPVQSGSARALRHSKPVVF